MMIAHSRLKHRLLVPIMLAALTFYFVAPAQNHAQLFAMEDSAPLPDASSAASSSEALDFPDGEGSPANEGLAAADGKGGHIQCKDLPEAQGGVLLGRIVPCITRTVATTTEMFSAKMIAMLMPTFYAFLTFVIAMFGLKVLQGGQDLQKEALLLLLKVTIVLTVLAMIPHTLVPSIYGIMSEMQTVVSANLQPGSSSFHCNVDKYGDENTPLIWAQMDCLLGKLYGFSTGAESAAGGEPRNMFLAASMFGAAAGFFFSGAFGVTVFFALIGVLLSVFLLVLRTAMAFLNGYLLVCVLMLIAPLFLPLVFLRVTKNYFEQWWKALLSALLMPTLVAAYSIFALMLYDKMLFAPDALVNKLFEYDVIQKAQQTPLSACDKQVTGDPEFREKASEKSGLAKIVPEKFYNIPLVKQGMAGLTGANNACAGLKKQVLDLGAIDSPEFKNAKAAFENIFQTCIKLMILAFMLAKGMDAVMSAIRLMSGSQVSSALLQASSPQEQALMKRFDNAQAEVVRTMKTDKDGNPATNRGADFVDRIGPSITGAVKRFVE
jgi:hypothetical protein